MLVTSRPPRRLLKRNHNTRSIIHAHTKDRPLGRLLGAF